MVIELGYGAMSHPNWVRPIHMYIQLGYGAMGHPNWVRPAHMYIQSAMSVGASSGDSPFI